MLNMIEDLFTQDESKLKDQGFAEDNPSNDFILLDDLFYQDFNNPNNNNNNNNNNNIINNTNLNNNNFHYNNQIQNHYANNNENLSNEPQTTYSTTSVTGTSQYNSPEYNYSENDQNYYRLNGNQIQQIYQSHEQKILEEQEDIDQSINNKDTKSQKLKVSKKISKKYEPIVDCNKVYDYHTNKDEYKKIRKRIQNRESAMRVRNRKKNLMQTQEQDIDELKQINAELMLKNAALTAENNMLKQNISFLQKIMMKQNKIEDISNISDVIWKLDKQPPILNENQNAPYILPVVNNALNPNSVNLNNNQENNEKFIRAPTQNSQNSRKQISMLGVLTIMLFIFCFNMFSGEGQTTGNDAAMQFTQKFQHLPNFQPKEINSENGYDYNKTNQQNLNNYLENTFYYSLKNFSFYIFSISYCFYLVYVVYSIFKNKSKLKTN